MLQEIEEKRIILYYKNPESEEKLRIMIRKPTSYDELIKKIYLILEKNPKEYHVDLYIVPSLALIFPGNFFLVRDNDIIQLQLEKIKHNKRVMDDSKKKEEERKRSKKIVEITNVNNNQVREEEEMMRRDIDDSVHEEIQKEIPIMISTERSQPKEIQKEKQREVMAVSKSNVDDELDRLERELEKELKDLEQQKRERLDERSMNITTSSQLNYASLTPPHVEEMEDRNDKRKEKNCKKIIEIKKSPQKVDKILDTPQNSPQRNNMIIENSPVVVPSTKKNSKRKHKDEKEEEDPNWEPSHDGEMLLGPKESEEEDREEEQVIRESPAKKIKHTQKEKSQRSNKKKKKSNKSSKKEKNNTDDQKNINNINIINKKKTNRVIETEDSPIKKSAPSVNHEHQSTPLKKENKKQKKSVKFFITRIDEDDNIESSFDDSDTGNYYPPLIEEDSFEDVIKNYQEKSNSEDSYANSNPAKISSTQKKVLFVDDITKDDQIDYDSSSPIRETRISDYCKNDSYSFRSPTKFIQQKSPSKSPSPSKAIWTKEELMKKVHFSTWQELREIAKKLGVKAKGTKDDLRQKLLRRIKYSI